MKEYSFKKTLGKGIYAILLGLAGLVTIAGVGDVSLWALAEQYIKPILAGLTVSGLIAMAVNATKFHLIGRFE